jgi:hypothetical protein
MSATFVMRRSGREGPVAADGCVFQDGRTVVAWRGEHASVAVYQSPESMMAVHRHKDTWILCPEGWEMSLDPWHADAFKLLVRLDGTPADGVVVSARRGPFASAHGPGLEGRPRVQHALAARQAVWMVLDAWGNEIGTAPSVREHATETP